MCWLLDLNMCITRLQRISFFYKKNDEMTKTGRRDENVDFWWNLTKLAKFGICGKIFDEICTFWRTKNGIFGGKVWRRARESINLLSHKFNHVTVHHYILELEYNDEWSANSQCDSKRKEQLDVCSGYPIFSCHLFFFLEKSRSQKPRSVLTRLHRIS